METLRLTMFAYFFISSSLSFCGISLGLKMHRTFCLPAQQLRYVVEDARGRILPQIAAHCFVEEFDESPFMGIFFAVEHVTEPQLRAQLPKGFLYRQQREDFGTRPRAGSRDTDLVVG